MSLNGSCPPNRLPVLVLFNQAAPQTRREDQLAELGVLESVGATVAALSRAGYSVETLGLGDDIAPLVGRLSRSPAVVVNYCEAFGGNSKGESYVAGVLELLGVPYTGSPPDALALCLDKIRTKRVLAGGGLPTPPYLEYTRAADELSDVELEERLAEEGVEWPVLVKAASEDASHGLSQKSVCQTVGELREAARCMANQYGYPALVEQFIDGREFNACVIDDPLARALPLEEIAFDKSVGDFWPIVTYDAKWVTGCAEDRATVALCPSELDGAMTAEIARLAIEAVRLTGCRDYTRVDLRMTPEGRPYILEVNANPDLGPEAGVVFQLEADGITLDKFLVQLVEQAVRRRPVELLAAPREAPCRNAVDVELRALRAGDRDSIRGILENCGNFRTEEVAIGDELVDEALADPDGSGYEFIVAARDQQIVGFTCFGPVPLTEGVWDLYWIAVHPDARGGGIAHQLQLAMEERIRAAGGRMILAETSSLPNYTEARTFYVRHGYQLCDQVADYYRPGDDRVTFGKRL